MKISELGLSFIKLAEGLKTKAYHDSAGVRTIGYGHAYWTGAEEISADEAEKLLKTDIVKFENKVLEYDCLYHFTQNEFDALVSFAFNVGSIKQLTDNGERPKSVIADKMMLYYNSGGKLVEGLRKRRQAERDIFLLGIYSYPYDLSMELGRIEVPSSLHDFNDKMYTAKNAISGLYGNGEVRARGLARDGYDYKEIQRLVNLIIKYESVNVVSDVISGKYGNGEPRAEALKAEGFDAEVVQWLVNYTLKKGK